MAKIFGGYTANDVRARRETLIAEGISEKKAAFVAAFEEATSKLYNSFDAAVTLKIPYRDFEEIREWATTLIVAEGYELRDYSNSAKVGIYLHE